MMTALTKDENSAFKIGGNGSNGGNTPIFEVKVNLLL